MKPIFINNFQKGSEENPNIGMGTMVGIDIYTKKGVAILAKKSTTITSGFTGIPHFIENSLLGGAIWVQCSDGTVLASTDGGSNFSDTSFPGTPISGGGNGLIYFQGYIFAFTPTALYYHDQNPATGSWTSWKTGLNNLAATPITNPHFPFLFPSNRGVYFCNGGAIGFFGQVGTTTFNPAGVSGTDYLYNAAILSLPSLTYVSTCLNFLPPSKLAIASFAYQNPSQGSDLITWDTVSANKFDPPLRLYSDSLSNSTVTAGIKQLYARNNVLYAVSGGGHTIYETNGSNFNLIDDVSLYSSIRTSGGAENTSPVYFDSYPQAINVVGNKLYTGVAPVTNTSAYPPTGTGFFPVGIWSITFNPDGTKSIQCEHPLPLGDSTVSPTASGDYAKITTIKPITQIGSSTGKMLAGFAINKSGVYTDLYGVMVVDLYKFIDNINFTAIESPLWEIGTALNPRPINNIDILLAKKLLAGQTVDIAYRKTLDDQWTTLDTFTGDGTKDSYKVNKNPIGATRFLQLRLRMATGSGGSNQTDSPELRNVIVS